MHNEIERNWLPGAGYGNEVGILLNGDVVPAPPAPKLTDEGTIEATIAIVVEYQKSIQSADDLYTRLLHPVEKLMDITGPSVKITLGYNLYNDIMKAINLTLDEQQDTKDV